MSEDGSQVSLLFAIAIALVAALGRLVGGSWRHPAALFAGYWFLTSAPALLAIPDEVDPGALLLILLFSISVFGGAELGRAQWASAPHDCGGNSFPVSGEWSGRLVFVWIAGLLSACGFGATLFYLVEGPATFSSLLTFEGWIENAAYFSIARYVEDYVEPLPLRFLSALNYAGALVGGVLMAESTRRFHRVVALLPLLFGVLITMITTAKAGGILCGVFFLSSYSAMTCQAGRAKAGIGAFAIVAGLGAFGSLTILAMILRYGLEESFTAGLLGDRLASYVFGHMAALSAWLDWDGIASTGPLLGLRSFAGVAEVLGLTQRLPGLYVPIPRGAVAAETNIFTALRGLIEDFTLPGGLFVMGCLSFIGGYAFEALRRGRRSFTSILSLTIFYAFVGFSPATNVFMYNVDVLAFGIFAIALSQLHLGMTRTAAPGGGSGSALANADCQNS
jgi:oligosaccharide repeat unit polymerase